MKNWKRNSSLDFINKNEISVVVAKVVFHYLHNNFPNVPIKQIAQTTSGGTPLRNESSYYNGNIPWLKYGELNDGLITQANEFITELGIKNSSTKIFPKGTLLLAMYGATAGRVGVLDFDSATNQAICALFPNEEINQEYLYWFLRQYRFDFIEVSKGGAQPNISQAVIRDTVLPLPPKDIQDNIVEYIHQTSKGKKPDDIFDGTLNIFVQKVFSVIDESKVLSSEITSQQTLLKKLRQQILQDAISGKLTAKWREENPNVEPASKLLARIKAEKDRLVKEKKIKIQNPLPPIRDEEIPFELPDGWAWCRLGEVSENYDGLRVPISKPERDRRERIYDYYGASGIIDKIDSFTHFGDFLLIGEDGANLVSRSTPIAFIVRGKFWVNNHAHALGFLNDGLLRFIDIHINGISLEPYITGGFQPKLSQNNLNNILIALPPEKELMVILGIVENTIRLCIQLETQSAKSQNEANLLMQAVLKEAFGG